MTSKTELKEWRSEEIAKIFLRKSTYKLNIEPFPTPVFDFFITQLDKPRNRFAVEVKTKNNFNGKINSQLKSLTVYRNNGMINIPVILIKIDEVNETGEIDYLVVPSKTGKLLIKKNYSFKTLTSETLDSYIDKINDWWTKQKK